MTGSDFFELQLAVQVALGAGYLGYVTAYAGYRREHGVEDTLFISLAFAAIASLVFGVAEAEAGRVAAFFAAVAASLFAACLWRVRGRSAWLSLMEKAKVHRDDGVHAGWSTVVQSGYACEQCSVHLKDGRVLYLHDRDEFDNSPWQGLYLGGDGSVLLAVQEEEMPDGKMDRRDAVYDETYGTRLTFIPASEVARVNLRLK